MSASSQTPPTLSQARKQFLTGMAQFVQTLNLDHPMSQAVALEAAVNFFDEENHKTQLDVSDNLNSSLEKNREIRTTSIVKKIE